MCSRTCCSPRVTPSTTRARRATTRSATTSSTGRHPLQTGPLPRRRGSSSRCCCARTRRRGSQSSSCCRTPLPPPLHPPPRCHDLPFRSSASLAHASTLRIHPRSLQHPWIVGMDDDARSQSTTAAATSGARTMWDRVRQLQRADRADVRTTLTAVRVGGTPAGAPTATRPKDARFPSAHLAATRRMLLSAAAAASGRAGRAGRRCERGAPCAPLAVGSGGRAGAAEARIAARADARGGATHEDVPRL